MLRPAILFVLLALAFSASQAYQVQPHGVPSSVSSPTSEGPHGVPSSVASPTPVNPGVHFRGPNSRVIFGNPRIRHKRTQLVVVPVFYPVGTYAPSATPPDQPSGEDMQAEQPDSGGASAGVDEEALREAYNRGAQDALARQQAQDRYGEHYFDSRERKQEKPRAGTESKKPAKSDDPAEPPAPPPRRPEPQPEENPQPTIFIFKDGRKLETTNFAIVGQTLFDLTSKPLRKIKLAEIDLDATRKANEEIGTLVTLP